MKNYITDDFDLSLADREAIFDSINYKNKQVQIKAYKESMLGDIFEALMEMISEMMKNFSFFGDKKEEREENINKSKEKAARVTNFLESLVKNDNDTMGIKIDKTKSDKKVKLDKEFLNCLAFLRTITHDTNENTDIDLIAHHFINTGYDSAAVKNSFMMYAMNYGYTASFTVFKTFGNQKDATEDDQMENQLKFLGVLTSLVEILAALSVIVIYEESKTTTENNINDASKSIQNNRGTSIVANNNDNVRTRGQSVNLVMELNKAANLLGTLLRGYSEDITMLKNSKFVQEYKTIHDVIDTMVTDNGVHEDGINARIGDIENSKNSTMSSLNNISSKIKDDNVKTIPKEEIKILLGNSDSVNRLLSLYNTKLNIISQHIVKILSMAKNASVTAVGVTKLSGDQTDTGTNSNQQKHHTNASDMHSLFDVMLQQNNLITELTIRVGKVLEILATYMRKLNNTTATLGSGINSIEGVDNRITDPNVPNDPNNPKTIENTKNMVKEQWKNSSNNINDTRTGQTAMQNMENIRDNKLNISLAKDDKPSKLKYENKSEAMYNYILDLFNKSPFGENTTEINTDVNTTENTPVGNTNGQYNISNSAPSNISNNNIDQTLKNNASTNNTNLFNNNNNGGNGGNTNQPTPNVAGINNIVSNYSRLIASMREIVKNLVRIPDENNKRLTNMNNTPTLFELAQGKGLLNTASVNDTRSAIELDTDGVNQLVNSIANRTAVAVDLKNVVETQIRISDPNIVKFDNTEKQNNRLGKAIENYNKRFKTHYDSLDENGKERVRNEIYNTISGDSRYGTTIKNKMIDIIEKRFNISLAPNNTTTNNSTTNNPLQNNNQQNTQQP